MPLVSMEILHKKTILMLVYDILAQNNRENKHQYQFSCLEIYRFIYLTTLGTWMHRVTNAPSLPPICSCYFLLCLIIFCIY